MVIKMGKYSKLIIPMALCYGAEAKLAIENKLALPIAASNIAFGLVRVVYRDKLEDKIFTLAQLLELNDDEISAQLANITMKRSDICALDMRKSHVMGIANLTPDSFSDGGSINLTDGFDAKIDQHINDGLSILDIGGESTRPNASYISVAQEIDRIAPILEFVKNKNICVSIDSRKAMVMAYALEHGADLINDVSGLEFRANMADHGEDSGDSLALALQKKCPTIIMHSQGTPDIMQNNPQYENILFEIYDYLQSRIDLMLKMGFRKADIIIDPGIGFGKTLRHNMAILQNLTIFHSLGVIVLLGTSRKAFIGEISNAADVTQRLGGSLGIMQLAIASGVQINRMHDIGHAVQQNHVLNMMKLSMNNFKGM